MALKFELEQWGAAVEAYDENDYDASLETFVEINKMSPSAKFYFNIGLIHATLGEHEAACRSYKRSVSLDQYFAVAYFQKGVSHFLLEEFNKALANFNDALLYLRGNLLIDYEQLGLKFRLYSCEVLFNRGLCYLYLGQTEQGENDFSLAVKEKQTEDHDVIDEAIEAQGQGFTVFSIPIGVIYRPPEGKLKNVKTKDYLGKAKLVAAVDPEDAFTGFSGAQQQKKAQMNTTTPVSNARTDGAVDLIPRPDSPTDKLPRPRSLSTNPRTAPFPLRTTRSSGSSKSRLGDIVDESPQNGPLRSRTPIPLIDEPTQIPPRQGKTDTQQPRNGSIRRPPPNQLHLQHTRSNTIDSGRPSPKLPNAPVRMGSMRDQNRSTPSRSNSVRNQAVRNNSPRGGSPQLRGRGGRSVPQRQNTSARAQFLQNQMQNMVLSDDENYADYLQNTEPINPVNDNDKDYSQVYGFMSENDKYYSADSDYLRPIPNNLYDNDDSNNYNNNNNNNNNRSPIDQRVASPALSSTRGRGTETNFKPLAVSTPNYANIIFSDDGYGDDDDTQFEMLPPPQKNPASLKEITKVKIKVYGKTDTRVVLVPTDIVFSELMKRIQEKFASDIPLKLKYKDDDGTLISMTDQEDLELAIAMIPKSSDGVGRFELWE